MGSGSRGARDRRIGGSGPHVAVDSRRCPPTAPRSSAATFPMPPGGRVPSCSPIRGWPASCDRQVSRTSRPSRRGRSTIRPGSGERRRTIWSSTGSGRPTTVLDLADGPEWARWWLGGAFNYADAATGPRAERDPDGQALAWEGEPGDVRTFTNAELRDAVERAARGVPGARRRAGRSRRDLPADAARDGHHRARARHARGDLHADLLGLRRARRSPRGWRDCEAPAPRHGRRVLAPRQPGRASRRSPTRPSPQRRPSSGSSSSGASGRRLPSFRGPTAATSTGTRRWPPRATARRRRRTAATTDPETPYMLIYTSGTTGRPKGAVHVHGGFPIKGAQDLAHTFDLRPGDALFWFTDLGWMMGPWAISGVAPARRPARPVRGRAGLPGPRPDLGARRAPRRHPSRPLADRRPGAHPARHGAGPRPRPERASASSARPASRGTPIRGGGTSARSAADAARSSTTPAGPRSRAASSAATSSTRSRPASFNGPCPGTAADVVDAGRAADPGRGRRARHPPAAAGPDARLLERPGSLRRDVLEPAPRHLGPRRLGDRRRRRLLVHPRPLGRHAQGRRQAGRPGRGRGGGDRPSVASWRPPRSACPTRSRARRSSSSAPCRPGETDDPELRAAIGRRVVEDLGKTLRPEAIVVVPALPKTRSGKIMRRVIRAAYLGLDPGDLSALDDPSTIEAIRRAGPTTVS